MTRANIEGRRGKNRIFFANESEVFDGAAFIYFGKIVFFFFLHYHFRSWSNDKQK